MGFKPFVKNIFFEKSKTFSESVFLLFCKSLQIFVPMPFIYWSNVIDFGFIPAAGDYMD